MTKKKQPVKQLSPNEYIKTKARSLPIYKCYINSYWYETEFAYIIVSRQHTNGNFTFGMYFMDIYGRGLYQSNEFFNKTKEFMDDLVYHLIPDEKKTTSIIEIAYSLAHNLIYGAAAFALKLGYKPEKNFEITKFILEEDNGVIEFIEIGFGKNEKLAQLEKDENDIKKINKDNLIN